MARDYLIGVDMGTSVVKASLFSADGTTLAHASRSVPLYQPEAGLAEQQGDDFYAYTVETIKEVIDRAQLSPNAVSAIGFDGQMGGAMGIDRDWRAITPWYPSTLDNRHQPYMKEAQARFGDRQLAIGGAVPLAAPRMLWWKSEYPELYEKINKVVILANFVAGRMAGLTGEEAFIDPSYLTWYGLADTARRAWSDELVELWGVDADKLPQIVNSTSVIGVLTPASARACGLMSGIPLVAGAGDQVAGFVGAGLVDVGQFIDVAGTFPVFSTSVDRFVVDQEYGFFQSLAGPLADNHWYLMTYIGGGGLTHRWFAQQFANDLRCDTDGSDAALLAKLDEEAKTIQPGADGLIFVPHLAGRACPADPDMRGTWIGFTWTHQRAHFYRSILESIAYDYAQALIALRHHLPAIKRHDVRVIGGGAQSRVWNRIKADVLGLTYRRLHAADRASMGGAIMAGHAIGLYPNMASTARQFAQTIELTEPDPDTHDHYQSYVHAYGRVLDQLDAAYGTLADLRKYGPLTL